MDPKPTTKVNDTRRSPKARAPRATVALEDSRGKPSRKSTRGASNRQKPSQTKERTAQALTSTPSARHGKRRF